MHKGETPTPLRRSSRVPTSLPVLVTSLDGTQFSECETLVVNAHGCAMLSRVKFDTGSPLRLHIKEGRKTTARVVTCHPASSDNQSWRLGARLDRPGNFWGMTDCPEDWALAASRVASPQLIQKPSHRVPVLSDQAPRLISEPTPEMMLESVSRRIEAQVTKMIAEAVVPLRGELATLKEKLVRRGSNPSRFEVSLSSIPPELEQQLELRIRKDLSPRVLAEAQQQSTRLLASAKAAIDQKTTEAHEHFLRRVREELGVVDKRAQEISAHISENSRDQMRRGLEEFQQKLLDGGNSLKRLGEELFEFLQHNLNEDHNVRREELEQLRASVASESKRLREEIEHLESRIAKLNESARCLESGLDQRLSQMASHTIKDTRGQLESVANDIVEESATRNTTALATQLEETVGNMKIVQKGIIASVSESLKIQATDSLQNFEHSMEESAKLCVERWRQKFAGGLNALLNSLGAQFQSDGESGS